MKVTLTRSDQEKIEKLAIPVYKFLNKASERTTIRINSEEMERLKKNLIEIVISTCGDVGGYIVTKKSQNK